MKVCNESRPVRRVVLPPFEAHQSGFSLIELMIALVIAGIIAAFALPSYRDYMMRGYAASAANQLSSMRAQMEQYYQDNRQYTASGSLTPPCSTAAIINDSSGGQVFSIACSGGDAPTATTYTISAAGSGAMAGFKYTINQTNQRATVLTASRWGSGTYACWVLKKGQGC